MRKEIATFLITSLFVSMQATGFELELNASYDFFRGIPDGSWNGNTGAYVSANLGLDIFDWVEAQVGGSYGVYNWDGRENLVFENPKAVLQEGFVTAGLTSTSTPIHAGIVYDRIFTKHFGIYNLSPSVDQLRFQAGYQFCCQEVGIWGTGYLTTARENALGLPISFRAINQLNLYWSHCFESSAQTMIWIGAPYGSSLRNHHNTAGALTAGFALRARLTERLFIDGHGAYMRAHTRSGFDQSRNYGANVCVGITYLWGPGCVSDSLQKSIYMPVANNANFLVDTNFND